VAEKNLVRVRAELVESVNLPYPLLNIGDLLVSWPEAQKIDLILANLPYIPSSNLKLLPNSVADFEPRLALNGGPDGLRLIDKLLQQAKNLLSKDGQIMLEVDESHTLTQFSQIRPEYNFSANTDCFGKFRFVVAKLKL
jgi:methylase of polypeptide subunit release factors